MEVEGMSRSFRVGVSAAVISAVALSAVFLAVVAPGMWWLVTIYGWMVFPALGLLGRGKSRVSGNVVPNTSDERVLLEALGREGELTAVRAAILTSLSAERSEHMLRNLAEEGHLRVKVLEGGISYAMWEVGEDSKQELER